MLNSFRGFVRSYINFESPVNPGVIEEGNAVKLADAPEAKQALGVSSTGKAGQFAKSALSLVAWTTELTLEGVGIMPFLEVIPPAFRGAEKTKKYVKIMRDKKKGLVEQEFVNPKEEIQNKLISLEERYGKEYAEFGDWLGDTLGKLITSLTSDTFLARTGINVLGKELIVDTIKANLLNILVISRESMVQEPVALPAPEVAENLDLDLDLNLDLVEELAPVQEAVALPAPEEAENLDMDLDLALVQEAVAPPVPEEAENLDVELDLVVEEHPPVQEAVAPPAPEEVQNLDIGVEDEPIRATFTSTNPLQNLIKAIPYQQELIEINEEKKKALLEIKELQSQIAILKNLENQDSTAKAVLKQQATDELLKYEEIQRDRELNPVEQFKKALSTTQLQYLDVLEQNDQAVIYRFRKQINTFITDDANILVGEIKQKIKDQVENQENLIKERIIPAILSLFFPKGAKSVLIYHPSMAVYPIQNKAWDFIQNKAPEYLSQLLPFLLLSDLPAQKALLDDKPYAPLVEQGVDLLFNDVMKIIFDKFKLPEASRLVLAEFFKPYVDYLAFNFINTVAQLDQEAFVRMIEIIGEARSQLSHTKDREGEIIVDALNSFYKLLPLESHKELLGLPSLISNPILKKILTELTMLVYNYGVIPLQDMSQQKIVELPNDAIAGTTLKVSDVRQSLTSILNFQLSKQLNPKRELTDTGYAKIVNTISKNLGKQLQKQSSSYGFAGFLGNLLEEGTFNPLIRETLELLRTEPAHPLKWQLIELLNPLLVNASVTALTPILEKEKVGGQQFDLELMTVALPLITEHFKWLNQPAITDFEVELSNVAREKVAYPSYAEKILNFFLPNAQASVATLFPNLSKKDQAEVWKLTSHLPSLLGLGKDLIFEKDMFKDIVIAIYESCIETFTEVNNNSQPPPAAPARELTPEELAFQARLDADLEELLYEVARFTDLPVDGLLSIMKHLPGNQSLKNKVIQSIRKALYKQADGHLLEKNIKKGLASQLNKVEHVINKKPANYLDTLEREFVKQGILFGLRSTADAIKNALKALDYPIVKQVKDAVVALVSFMMVRIIGGFLHLIGLDTKVVDKIYALLKRNREKFHSEFVQPSKNIGVGLEVVGAVERVLEKNWGPVAVR